MRMNGTRKNKGFTLAEILLVVAIVVILAGVAFIAVERYQRSTTLLEMDGIAKEIFVAAQNHLSMADSQGLLKACSVKGSTNDFVTAYYTPSGAATTPDVRYFVVPDSDSSYGDVTSSNSVLNLMLPQAAVDETVRLGGSYIVVYDYASATVLDVFYSRRSGNMSHPFTAVDLTTADNGVSSLLKNYGNTGAKNSRKSYDGNSVIGWYGGAGARLTADPSNALDIEDFRIVNSDTLYAVIPNPNEGKSFAELRLYVHGKTSGADAIIDLVKITNTETNEIKTYSRKDSDGNFVVVLDDVTSSGEHFAEVAKKYRLTDSADFLPGEDIELTLEAYSSTEIVTMPAPIGPKTTNSLFAAVSGGTAEISSFRHLENLDDRVSCFADAALAVTGAKQTVGLVWSDFVSATPGSTVLGADPLNGVSADLGGGADKYYPVDMPQGFDYDGQNNSITGVKIEYAGNFAGLFGTVFGGTVENLELVDFSVKCTKDPLDSSIPGSGSAGALAGRITNSGAGSATVQNVLVRDSSGGVDSACAVTATGNAGGLVGFVNGTGSSVTNCAAAVRVEGSGDAGGLIGNIGGSSVTVSGSYSGGRTENGAYNTTYYNITAGGSAGGLVGDAGSAHLTQCYSTCSATGAVAGGLAGKAAFKLTSCYATGRVSGATEGALVGAYTGAYETNGVKNVNGCRYYEIINERITGSGATLDIDYIPFFGSSAVAAWDVTALDASADTYNSFLGTTDTWDAANPYDSALGSYYIVGGQSKYPLSSISDLLGSSVGTDYVAVHYGDWPAPELWIKNEKS